MKWIKYIGSIGKRNVGTEDNPEWEDIWSPMALSYCEYNEEIAKKEAYNGKYTIEDDGQPEPEVPSTSEDRIAELEGMLNALLGVTE